LKNTTDPYAALRHPEFVSLITANSFITIATLIQEVVIGYELYNLTNDPLTLGYIGLAEAIPYISLALFGGHFADRRDKRTILQISLLALGYIARCPNAVFAEYFFDYGLRHHCRYWLCSGVLFAHVFVVQGVSYASCRFYQCRFVE
jgi:hypothetical protein